jgi:hypothetical protein
MAITIYSPHSGHPVKVREADVGRAIRDEGGRIFYVVARAEGGGYYGSMTRHGSAKDEQRYVDLERRIQSGEFVPEPVAESQAAAASSKPYDATGGRRISPVRLLVVVLILLLVLAGLGLGVNWWFDLGLVPLGGETDRPDAAQQSTGLDRPIGQAHLGPPRFTRAATGPPLAARGFPSQPIQPFHATSRPSYHFSVGPCPAPGHTRDYRLWHFAV